MNRSIILITLMFALQPFIVSSARKNMSFTRVGKQIIKPIHRHYLRLLSTQGGSSPTGGDSKLYEVSVCAVQGGRSYMEDEYFVNQAGNFGAVFDGHGGPAVSRYLRQNLYANLQSVAAPGAVFEHQKALSSALHKVDTEVQHVSHWSFQGSTAVAAWILPEQTLIVANIGDSRAVLSHNDTSVELTQDHKPNAPKEKARIAARGGKVVWSGLTDREGRPVPDHGVYRVNGNLALSRAVGDRSERPAISAEPEFTVVSLDENAQFVVLATDGLWDVMTSEEVVSFCHFKLRAQEDAQMKQIIQRKMAEFLVAEALRRGTVDNVTVVILWL